MSELSPVDESVLAVLRSSRLAQEQETTDLARAMHEDAYRQDRATTIGGLLLHECAALRSAFTGREKYYLEDANWLQRRRLLRSGQMRLPVAVTMDGKPVSLSRGPERRVRAHNVLRNRQFWVDGLLPTEPEYTDAGPIAQDWIVATKPPFFVLTSIRTINTERSGVIAITPVHKINTMDDIPNVKEGDNPIYDADLYLPLGLVMAANRKVRGSVPRRISKNW